MGLALAPQHLLNLLTAPTADGKIGEAVPAAPERYPTPAAAFDEKQHVRGLRADAPECASASRSLP